MKPAKLASLLILMSANVIYGQVRSLWQVKNPFEQKCFIENNAGQFNYQSVGDKALFKAECNGLEMLFTQQGITYRHYQLPGKAANNEEEEKVPNDKVDNFHAEWLRVNDSVEVVPEEEIKTYSCYTVHGQNVIAHEFKKLLYKNLYKGIDIEYSFPADSNGIEYMIIVHPGADLSAVRLLYPDAGKVVQDNAGNIHITASSAGLVDHVPSKTYYAGSNKEAFSRMLLKGNEITFDAGNYARNKTLVIDPWQDNSNTCGYAAPFDLCTDNNGNVYVYGQGISERLLSKFDNSGTQLWSRQINEIYGDFTVDKSSGVVFVGTGNNVKTELFKITTTGAIVNTLTIPDSLGELWRMDYNSCTGTVLVAGGGVNNSIQAASVDTMLANAVEYNVLGTTQAKHDMEVLCTDKYTPDCYMATSRSQTDSLNFDNTLVKCSVPNFTPVKYSVHDGFLFRELGSIQYDPFSYLCNGMNGIASGYNMVYIYDGARLAGFDKNTGAFVKVVKLGVPLIGAANQVLVKWGGITTDACGNIYVGHADSIIAFDSSLNRIGSFLFAGNKDTIYDLQTGINNQLFACGLNAICAYSLAPFSKGLVKVTSPACSGCNGTAFVYFPCAPQGTSYSWSTGDTTQDITHLCAGTYSVTVRLGCEVIANDTVNISPSGNPSVNIPSDSVRNVSCYGATNGSAYAVGSGGAPPYTYVWFPQNYKGDSISNVSAGTYTVIVTDTDGCSGIGTVNILEPPALGVNTNPGVSIGEGASTILTATASGGTPPYTFTWNDTVQSASVTVSPSENTTYTVVVTDSNGCKAAQIVHVDILCGEVFVPDAFSPNGDGQNDILLVRGRCIRDMKFFVFDRWGNKVFEGRNISDGWDGNYKGKPMNTGTYVWYLKATLQDGSMVEKKGNVALIR